MPESLKDYNWQYRYCSSSLNANGQPTDILHDFYLPALSRIVRYDRVAGYFRSTSLAAASQGYTAFLNNGGKMRLIVGADLQIQDVAAILAGNRQKLSDALMKELDDAESWPQNVQNGVALLGAMVSSGQLEVRVAFRVNANTHQPIKADSVEDGYVHEKWMVMADADGNRIYGSGSLNESRTALELNAENIDVHCDWKSKDARERTDGAEADFNRLWENKNPHMLVESLPDAVKDRLIHLKKLNGQPTEVDGTVIPVDIKPTLKEILLFSVLKDAPKMPNGKYIGLYSAPVEPWPHQEIVSRRLIESWPYSYMMCDEVGLGKTIEAALAMRSLILSGRVHRVMVVAPASLKEQWQRELAQKALLPFTLSQVKPGGTAKISHTTSYPQDTEFIDESLYSPDLNIVSSGLVSRKERKGQLRSMEQCDIILVDEAHYARRKKPTEGAIGNAEYGNLYRAMQDGLRRNGKSLWMATATPMQIHPIEVYDLFRLTDRTGPFQNDPTLSMIYFELLGAIISDGKLTAQQWAMLGKNFQQIEALDPYLWDLLEHTAVSSKNRKALTEIAYREPKHADVKYLKQPLFSASPLVRVMMRHTRALLEIYKQNGELKSNLAHRNIRKIAAIKFTPDEAKFYEMLEAYCSELSNQMHKYNPQTRQVMVFLLNFLQLRFASSQYAIEKTLERRLRRVENTLLVGARSFDSEEELQEILDKLRAESESDDDDENDLNDITLDALLKDRSKQDLEWEKECIEAMLERLRRITETPSKIQALLKELDSRRLSGGRLKQTVLFTRFYDSLYSIREYLRVKDPELRVGVYAGGRAFWFDPSLGKDASTTHEDIKHLFLAGEIDLLLCTDAAAEGLNLQTADLLINFDLGWNPMKIEQRIGRIDRIGQKHKEIDVMNMCYLGSAEETVYGRLWERLKAANIVVGTQQISMLPVSAKQFQELHSGEISLDTLTEESVRTLSAQKEAVAKMEMSAEDMYQMYKRMSANAKDIEYPASIDSIWSAIAKSPYLQSRGVVLGNDGYIHIPREYGGKKIAATANRDFISEDVDFLTWGNNAVDAIMSEISEELDESIGCIKRLSFMENGVETVGYAVSTTEGPILVTSFKEAERANIAQGVALSSSDIAQCQIQLECLAKGEAKQVKETEQVLRLNKEFADIHEKLIRYCAVGVLRSLPATSFTKYNDAIRELETHPKKIYTINLPYDVFSGKGNMLLFQVSENSGAINVTVSGILLRCVTELIKRTATTVKKKKSEITTSEIIGRILPK